jgi:hypothetical protein
VRYGEGVTDELPGYRTSSARKGRRGPSLLTAAVVIVVAIFAALAVRENTRRREDPDLRPTPPVPPTSTPTAAPAATATELVEYSSGWVEATAPTATPSPWPTIPPAATATPRPDPSPTPLTSSCVTYRWTAQQVFRPSALVMVEINAVNRCDRDLGPLELWFEITGWRQGGFVQSVRGHPFDRIRKGGSEIIAIGLPGSIDWYDEITVQIID